jgi:HSP20 family protein
MAIVRWASRWDPTRELYDIQRRLSSMLDNGWALRGLERWLPGHEGPPVNVYSKEGEIMVAMEQPGLDRKELDISVVGNTLTIKGKREAADVGEASYHRHERVLGEFSRTITLPQQVQAGKAQAQYEMGILTITLPKAEEAKARKIEVQAK